MTNCWTQVQLGNDINGAFSFDYSGYAIDMNGVGDIVAIGAMNNDGNGTNSGHVRVFEWNGSSWIQKGQDINGEFAGDQAGNSISLNESGNALAVGARLNDGNGTSSGHVRIYDWNGTSWVQRGADINGESANDYSGSSVDIDSLGNTVIIGAFVNDGINGTNSGHARVYDWNGTFWVQRGNDLDGEDADDHFGWRSSISNDGNLIAIGADLNDGNGINSGHVRVFEWNGTTWLQIGTDIDGANALDQFSHSVSLSGNGQRLVVGAIYGGGSNAGYIRVYERIGNSWVQVGGDIEGETNGDHFGFSAQTDFDGDVVVIGGPFNGSAGNLSGHIRAYYWDGLNWNQSGSDINGEAIGDEFGESVCINAAGNRIAGAGRKNDGNGTNSGHTRIYTIPCFTSPSIDTVIACDSYTWIDGNTYTASNNIATLTLTNGNGCDSIVTLDLTIIQSTTGTEVVTSCDPFTWIDGVTYTASNNTANYTLVNASGCDSIVTLDLTINPTFDLNVSVSGAVLTSDQAGVDYQWIDCTTLLPIPGAINQVFNVTTNGSYAVILSTVDCSDTTACVIVNSVGSEEHTMGNHLVIYPNPTDGIVFFDTNNSTLEDDVTIVLKDLSGRAIETSTYKEIPKQLNFNCPSGIYYIEIYAGGSLLREKMSVQH